MDITTKHNIGDRVWAIIESRAVCFAITAILVIAEKVDETHIASTLMYKGSNVGPIAESNCYPSKEELLNSL